MTIPIADLAEYLKKHGLRIVKAGWHGDKLVAVVAPVEEEKK